MYLEASYDLDGELLEATGRSATRVSYWSLVPALRERRPKVLELNEAFQVNAWPIMALVSIWLAFTQRRTRPRIVFYAIENLDPIESLRSRLRSTQRVAILILSLALRFVVPTPDRVCFGSQAAEENYRRRAPNLVARAETRLIEALPAPTSSVQTAPEMAAIFVGSFEDRKSVLQTSEAFTLLARKHPDWCFTVAGKGPLQREVQSILNGGTVELRIDPPRAVVRDLIRRSSVLVLASRPTPRWKEQIGLPILEALAEGLTVVTTPDTGLASWLSANGHYLTQSSPSGSQIAKEVEKAIISPLPRAVVVSTLPAVDARIAADTWMNGWDDA
ncbi:glycosyltransferase [Microbacterium invictum]|uniref:Glycosyltransferase n=1 Tax=Microbacterium invictum TaxID=515415 RepID=A0ABZ0V9I2_9MICO|nr:glycosyltransferase [Microbacterium invictum]WQB69799.1 glycosyltransferase [Microbacterium invictum]